MYASNLIDGYFKLNTSVLVDFYLNSHLPKFLIKSCPELFRALFVSRSEGVEGGGMSRSKGNLRCKVGLL